MKKPISALFVLGMILISVSLVQSCKKAPAIVACLAAAPSSASIGATLAFQSCTPNAVTTTWNFGDGNSTTGDSVTHVYTSAGTYHASLTVSNGSASNSTSFIVTIVPNSWSFQAVTYTIDSVVASQPAGTLNAAGSGGSATANLIFRLLPFPTVNGIYSYTVINAENGRNYLAPNELFVLLNRDSAGVVTSYGSTGSGPVVATVDVGNGKISVSLPVIELVNLNNQSDSTTVSGSVAQTQ